MNSALKIILFSYIRKFKSSITIIKWFSIFLPIIIFITIAWILLQVYMMVTSINDGFDHYSFEPITTSFFIAAVIFSYILWWKNLFTLKEITSFIEIKTPNKLFEKNIWLLIFIPIVSLKRVNKLSADIEDILGKWNIGSRFLENKPIFLNLDFSNPTEARRDYYVGMLKEDAEILQKNSGKINIKNIKVISLLFLFKKWKTRIFNSIFLASVWIFMIYLLYLMNWSKKPLEVESFKMIIYIWTGVIIWIALILHSWIAIRLWSNLKLFIKDKNKMKFKLLLILEILIPFLPLITKISYLERVCKYFAEHLPEKTLIENYKKGNKQILK